uniref:Uncharacterized protein n=1 Tax=Oryza sativa subsp. japonica TaxID=39947 RepID=Q69PH6_ORYSJ|nr:hypothetical protein [Oryza sativa Japonica Group]
MENGAELEGWRCSLMTAPGSRPSFASGRWGSGGSGAGGAVEVVALPRVLGAWRRNLVRDRGCGGGRPRPGAIAVAASPRARCGGTAKPKSAKQPTNYSYYYHPSPCPGSAAAISPRFFCPRHNTKPPSQYHPTARRVAATKGSRPHRC